MIDCEKIQLVVAKGLKEYCQCPVVRSNQTEELAEMDIFTYISFKITTPQSENNGSYGVYEDGTKIKLFKQIWSITAVSPDNLKSVMLASKAREWLDEVGRTYLSDNNIAVNSVGSVTNRDSFLSTEYECKNGFDVSFLLPDTIEGTAEEEGYIENTEIGGINVDKPKTTEELNNMLEKRLDGEVV